MPLGIADAVEAAANTIYLDCAGVIADEAARSTRMLWARVRGK